MSFPEFLQSFGIEMPSPLYLVGVLLFGIVGMVAWRHGKKSQQPTSKWLGATLMLYPYATPQTWLMYLIGSALCLWLFFSWKTRKRPG